MPISTFRDNWSYREEGAMKIISMLLMAVFLPLLILCSCGAGKETDLDPAARQYDAEMMHLLKARDYFTLRARLAGSQDSTSVQARLLRAVVQSAFNEPEESNATIASLFERADELPDTLRLRLLRLEIYNHVRLHRYKDAYEAALAILALPPASFEASLAAEVANELRVFRALADVPPQEAIIHDPTALHLEDGRVPVRIHGHSRAYTLDTGANFSVLMESEAAAMGLELRDVALEVGASTGGKTLADIAVADSMAIGNAVFRHVIFLIFPDSALTFPGGFRVPGLIGFPVIEAMGEIRFGTDGLFEIPAVSSSHRVCNLALEQLNLLVLVEHRSDTLIAMLDSGANRTLFYEPFFRRYRASIEIMGQPDTVTAGGAGGLRKIPAYLLPNVGILLGDTIVSLDRAHVLTEAIRSPDGNYLFCNIGQDVLYSLGGYSINFRSMSFLLG
jgi:hypothetical protein